jgi:hypothetical protein
MQKLLAAVFSLCFSCTLFYAQTVSSIEFYGLDAAGVDANMIDMTRNLYLTQLKEISSLTVTDRSKDPQVQSNVRQAAETAAGTGYAVYAEIAGDSAKDTNWICTLHARNMENGDTIDFSKEYSSYYKILTDAKPSITGLIDKIRGGNIKPDAVQTAKPIRTQVSTEFLAGTWQGEEYIAKIVILRGGRGFVIYKNGATMNINVTVLKSGQDGTSTISITQAGKPNASFFPELPRKIALENAPTAQPLQWVLTMTDDDTMSGTKETLIEDPASPTGARTGEAPVLWTRQ